MVLYELNEKELFNLLKHNMYDDLHQVTNDEYSANDAVSESFGIYVELKCRRTHYDQLMIEKLKFDRLKHEADMTGMIPYYICSTPRGIWGFNLDILPIQWEDRDDLPATTDFDNNERVTKTVGYLSVDKGTPLLPWYPEYSSEEEFFAANMEIFAEDMYTDPYEYEFDIDELTKYADE